MNSSSSTALFFDADITTYLGLPTPALILLIRALVPVLLLLLSILMWSVYHQHTTDPDIKLPLPPGSMGLPIIGETLLLLLLGNKFYESRRKRHGNVFKTHLLGVPIIRVIGAHHVKTILMGENSLVNACWPASVRTLLGTGSVSVAVGTLHRVRRRGLQRAFGHEAISGYVPMMQEVAREYIHNWCSQESVFGYPECKNMSFAIAAKALLGFELPPPERRGLAEIFGVLVDNLFSLPLQFPGSGLSKGLAARRKLLQQIDECLKRKQEALAETADEESVAQDAMSRLLAVQGSDALSLDELKDLCLELLFAGHATTASAATSLLIHLHNNSAVLARLREELDNHGLARVEEGDLTLSSLSKLEYAAAVVKEVLRVSPPVGGGFRTVLKSFTLNGYQIPAGWTVVYSIRQTQETTDFFLDADKFEPSRWLRKNLPEEKFHYLPFGGGSRTCVGKEFAKLFLRVFVVELTRSCTWTLENSSARMSYLPVPHPVDGLPVTFTEIPLSNRPRANTF